MALISAGAAIASALVTSAFYLIIENCKYRKAFDEKQKGLLSLLANDISTTIGGLGLLLEGQLARCANPASTISVEELRQIKLLLGSADNLTLPEIIRSYNYIPNAMQKHFTAYYRAMKELRLLCEYLEFHAERLEFSKHLPPLLGLVSRLVASGYKILGEKARFDRQYSAAIYYDNAALKHEESAALVGSGGGESA